jgi:hypothetical protein
VADEQPIRFELERLTGYTDDDLLAELRRVASLVAKSPLTRAAFDAVAKAKSTTFVRRFGGWREALAAAGLADRYSGQPVNDKMRVQAARNLTNDEVVAEMQRVARALGTEVLTREQLNGYSESITAEVVTRRFGTWKAGLVAANLRLSSLGRRHTDDDYFENLLAVWTHFGRQPRYGEMNAPPSKITGGAYEAKWGRWSLALRAFVDRMNADLATSDDPPPSRPPASESAQPAPPRPEDRREVRIGLRYAVLRRDRFRCVLCGASPATDLSCQLHVDHIEPFSKGGKTTLGNLRTLCGTCNVGRGNGD